MLSLVLLAKLPGSFSQSLPLEVSFSHVQDWNGMCQAVCATHLNRSTERLLLHAHARGYTTIACLRGFQRREPPGLIPRVHRNPTYNIEGCIVCAARWLDRIG